MEEVTETVIDNDADEEKVGDFVSLLLMDQLLVISIDSDGYVPVTVPEIVPL